MSATITIDPSIAPFLIGSRGSTVRRMEEVSGARIKVSADDGTVTIQGNSPAQVEGGRRAVMEQLSRSREHGGQSNGGHNNFEGSEATMTMRFDRDATEAVFGPRGATVRGIERESGGARVRVDKQSCTITAYGSKQAVARVKAAYTELLAAEGAALPAGSVVNIDPAQSRLLIGERGQTVKRLEQQSGARITVSKDGDGAVRLRGSEQAVAAARRLIEQVLANGGDDAAAGDFADTDEASANVEVAAPLIALVIGTRGQTVKGIEAETGARVNVGRDGVVAIRGSAAAVAAAEDRVRRIAASRSGETGY